MHRQKLPNYNSNKLAFNNKERWLTIFHDIPQMLPMYRVLDRIVESINHKSVTIKDIRSVILTKGTMRDHYNYNVMFRDTDTHRLIGEQARFNKSENFLYYLLDRGEIMKVTIPSTLEVIKKEVITETALAEKKLFTTRVHQTTAMTMRSVARLVDDAINHHNIFTTSSLEVGSIGWNPYASYVGFYQNEMRIKFEEYLRFSCNLSCDLIPKQSEIIEFKPPMRIQAERSGLTDREVHNETEVSSEEMEIAETERSTTPPLTLSSPSTEASVEDNQRAGTSTGGLTETTRTKFIDERKEKSNPIAIRKPDTRSKEKKAEKEQIKGLLKLVRTGKFQISLTALKAEETDVSNDSSSSD